MAETFPDAIVFGRAAHRVCNTSCIGFPGTHGGDTVERLAGRGVIVGSGSACSSMSLKPPGTLLAMGVPYDLAGSSIRVSPSRFTSESDLEALQTALEAIVGSRAGGPAYVQIGAESASPFPERDGDPEQNTSIPCWKGAQPVFSQTESLPGHR